MDNKEALTVQAAIKEIKTKNPKESLDGLAKMTILCAQGENCSSALHTVSKLMSKKNVQLIRQRNFINSRYAPDTMSDAPNVFDSIEFDFGNENPVIRAIAVRQAGNVASDDSVEKILPVITGGAKDPCDFVRKAAALSILKLFHANPSFVTRFNLTEVLLNLLRDKSAFVAGNAAAAITEINTSRTTPLLKVEMEDVERLMEMAKTIPNEWNKISIYDFASTYTPASPEEATAILKHLPGHIAHANSAVTIAAIRVRANMTAFIDEITQSNALRSSLMPLIVMMNKPLEIQYASLSCALLILQRFQEKNINDESFLPKFLVMERDPIYIKLQKLDILYCLMTQNNVLQIVNELAVYAKSKDEMFVRKTIQILGKIAVLSPTASDRCVEIIETLLRSKVTYCIHECIRISANIIRKYHDKYQRLVPAICQNMPPTLEDDDAKATLAWIIGEDSTKISNTAIVQRSHELIDTIFIHNYQNESPDVQLAIMAAVVKIFLTNPSMPEMKAMTENILSLSINNSDNPDIRDRAFFYLNIINDLGERALDVIASQEEQSLSAVRSTKPEDLIETLIPLIGTMANLYEKFPSEFVPPPIICDDSNQCTNIPSNGIDDQTIDFSNNQRSTPLAYPLLASSSQENFWTEISGYLNADMENKVLEIKLKITNNSKVNLEINRIVIKANALDITVKDDQTFPQIPSMETQEFTVTLTRVQPSYNALAEDEFNIAIVGNRPSSIFFGIPLSLQTVLLPESYGKMTKNMFTEQLQILETKPKAMKTLPCSVLNSANDAIEVLHGQNLVYIGKQGDVTIVFTACSISNEMLIIRISCLPNGSCNVEALCMNQEVANIIVNLIVNIIA